MNDLHNSIFENEKEFLERQEQEYKNALMGDVAVIKDSSEKIGRGVLLAGGVLAGVWLVNRMISGSKKKKKKKKKNSRKLLQNQNPYYAQPAFQTDYREPDPEVNFGSPLDFNQPVDDSDSALYNTPAKYFNPAIPAQLPENYALHQHYHAAADFGHAPSPAQSLGAELARAVVTQVSAFLLVYLSQKVEAYLTKNVDIAVRTEPEAPEPDYTYFNADAGTHL